MRYTSGCSAAEGCVVTRPEQSMAANLFADADQQESFVDAYAAAYQGTKKYGGLRKTENAILNAARGCNASTLQNAEAAGSTAGFAIGLIHHQLLVLLRNEEAYMLFAKFAAVLRNASRIIGNQVQVQLERQMQTDPDLTHKDKRAIRALEQKIFSKAA